MDEPRPARTSARLPEWNLADLYESPKAPELDSDLARAAADSKELAKRFQGKLAGLAATSWPRRSRPTRRCRMSWAASSATPSSSMPAT